MKPDYLFTAGWRVFFLAAGLWAVISVAIWLMWLIGLVDGGHLGVAPQSWHAHEMIFGYATAAMGGFFLTAEPNWTGAKAAPEQFVMLVSGLWLAGRLAVCLAGVLPPAVVAAIWFSGPEPQPEAEPIDLDAEFDAFAGGYPVPPMPGQKLAAYAGIVASEPAPPSRAPSGGDPSGPDSAGCIGRGSRCGQMIDWCCQQQPGLRHGHAVQFRKDHLAEAKISAGWQAPVAPVVQAAPRSSTG